MDWLATLRRSGGINAIARHVGASPVETAAGMEALLPPLIAGMRFFNARGDEAVGDYPLVSMLNELGDGDLAAQVMGPDRLKIDAGNVMLERLFGGKIANALDVAERGSDVEREMLDRILPPLAMLVGGYISARSAGMGSAGQGGHDALLASMLTQEEDLGIQRKGAGS